MSFSVEIFFASSKMGWSLGALIAFSCTTLWWLPYKVLSWAEDQEVADEVLLIPVTWNECPKAGLKEKMSTNDVKTNSKHNEFQMTRMTGQCVKCSTCGSTCRSYLEIQGGGSASLQSPHQGHKRGGPVR